MLNSEYLKNIDNNIIKLLLSENSKLKNENKCLQVKITKLEEELKKTNITNNTRRLQDNNISKNTNILTHNEILTIIFQNCIYAIISKKYDSNIDFNIEQLNEYIKDKNITLSTIDKDTIAIYTTKPPFKYSNPNWYINMSNEQK